MIMIMVVNGWTAKEEEIEESVRNLKRVELSWAGCALKLSPQIAICTQHRIQMRVQIPAKAQSKYKQKQKPTRYRGITTLLHISTKIKEIPILKAESKALDENPLKTVDKPPRLSFPR